MVLVHIGMVLVHTTITSFPYSGAQIHKLVKITLDAIIKSCHNQKVRELRPESSSGLMRFRGACTRP